MPDPTGQTGQADPPEDTLDLNGAAPEIAVSGSALEPPTKDIEAAQERTRGLIAVILVGILFFIVLAAFALAWSKVQSIDDLQTLLPIILGPVVALVGSATGFYFGGKK